MLDKAMNTLNKNKEKKKTVFYQENILDSEK